MDSKMLIVLLYTAAFLLALASNFGTTTRPLCFIFGFSCLVGASERVLRHG